MLHTFKQFVDMCRLRANPQDLPHSVSLGMLTLAIYTALSYLMALWVTAPDTAMLVALIDVGMLAGLAYSSVWILSLQSRATQLITALAGTGVLWQLVALPVIGMLSGTTEQGAESTTAGFGYLIFVALIAWIIAIIGHILRHALNMNFLFALGIAVLYVYTSMRVSSALLIAVQPH